MIVLGMIDSKPSSAAIMEGDEIVAAMAEERLCRMKLASGFPRQAIEEVIRLAGITPREIDRVAVAQRVSVFEPYPIPWKGWFSEEEKQKTNRFDRLSGRLAPIFGRFPLAWKAHHQIKRLLNRERLQQIPLVLKNDFGISAPIRYYDHHYCHATTAYCTSGFDQALVVTLDGGGDGCSGSVFLGRNGELEELARVDSYNSLGNFYSYVTELCGFRAEKDEGKITGLAALGQPAYADMLRGCIEYQDPGQIRYRIPMYHHSALEAIRERLPRDFDIRDLAASVQLVLEEIGTRFIGYWLKRTGMRHVAVAGGVFANVKFNQRVYELDGVESIFIHPGMDDGGLSLGSALAAQMDDPGVSNLSLLKPLENVYFGPAYDDHEVFQAVKSSGLPAEYVADVQERIAGLLAEGHVVARFTGAMEYGPRALGNRSILYQTADPSVNDWLNERLKRTEFMPFAPATLMEFRDSCYVRASGAQDAARFMTITFNCTDRMRRQSPGVVHVDGTARPQLIDSRTAPDFYRILSSYHRLTGTPSLINTSFNMHGEPIVCSPQDAVRSFQQGNLDYLAIESWLIRNPGAIALREQGAGAAQA